MKKIVITYGLISGLIVGTLMVVIGTIMRARGEYFSSYALSYASMITALAMIFFAIKNYRDNFSNGDITFGRGFLIGLYVTLIASVMYVITWKIYSAIAMPDWVAEYSRHAIDDLRKSGASDATIAAETKQMAEMAEMLKNPFIEIGMVFLEIFPVGLLISLISALALKRKKREVAIA